MKLKLIRIFIFLIPSIPLSAMDVHSSEKIVQFSEIQKDAIILAQNQQKLINLPRESLLKPLENLLTELREKEEYKIFKNIRPYSKISIDSLIIKLEEDVNKEIISLALNELNEEWGASIKMPLRPRANSMLNNTSFSIHFKNPIDINLIKKLYENIPGIKEVKLNQIDFCEEDLSLKDNMILDTKAIPGEWLLKLKVEKNDFTIRFNPTLIKIIDIIPPLEPIIKPADKRRLTQRFTSLFRK